MRKNVLSIAAVIAATSMLAAPVFAGDINYQIYGNVHLSLNFLDGESGDLASKTSAIGIKGNKKLGDSGNTVIFKVEFQVDPTVRNTDTALVDRDQWVGMKGAWGKLIAGTASSNYKQLGGKVDALYRTPIEGRGFLNLQSKLHNGAGEVRGRLTNMVQYTTPKLAGSSVYAVANTTFTGDANESYGMGLRYKTKTVMAYADYFSAGAASMTTGGRETAVKVGGSFKGKGFQIGAQYEASEDVVGYDYMFLNGLYVINDDYIISGSIGSASSDTLTENSSYAFALLHPFGKKTLGYIGYGMRDNEGADDFDAVAFGFRYKF